MVKLKILKILAYSDGRTYEQIATMLDDPLLSVDWLYRLKDDKLVTFDGDLWSMTVIGYAVMHQWDTTTHRICSPTKAGPLQHTGSGTYKGEDLKVQSTREGAYQYKESPSVYGNRFEPLRHV